MNCGKLATLTCGLLGLLWVPAPTAPRPAEARVMEAPLPRTVRIQVDVPEELVRELHAAGYDWRQKGRWELAGDKLVLCYDSRE